MSESIRISILAQKWYSKTFTQEDFCVVYRIIKLFLTVIFGDYGIENWELVGAMEQWKTKFIFSFVSS